VRPLFLLLATLGALSLRAAAPPAAQAPSPQEVTLHRKCDAFVDIGVRLNAARATCREAYRENARREERGKHSTP